MVIEVKVNVIGEVMTRTSKLIMRTLILGGKLTTEGQRNMLKHGIAVIAQRTVSVLQETRQIVTVIQYVADCWA